MVTNANLNSNVLQFPLKQHQTTQMVMPDGGMCYAYIVDFTADGEVHSIYLWARDEADAMNKLDLFKQTGRIRGRLRDYVEQQMMPPPPSA